MTGFPHIRPRRTRATPAMRRLVADVHVQPSELVLPMFIKEGLDAPRPIASMPGVVQHTRDSLRKAAATAAQTGIGGIMLFGIPAIRDSTGTEGTNPNGILNTAICDINTEIGNDLVVMADLCLDEFTDHGHCGVLCPDGTVDNDATLDRYADMALAQAQAGAHVLGASGMMDGQIGHVRKALDRAGYTNTSLLAYAVKYASACYGPFRDAVDSTLQGDRRTYQQDPARSIAEALREVQLDIDEGADIVMVKPALPYLDVVSAVAKKSEVPVAAYQVSGEYSMVEAAAARGWLDREAMMLETVTSIRRAGASIICTYWAEELAQLLRR